MRKIVINLGQRRPIIGAIPNLRRNGQPSQTAKHLKPVTTCDQLQFAAFLDPADMNFSLKSQRLNGNLQLRNQWMVDRADKVVALWDGGFGGTFNCIQYANRKRVPAANLWDTWDMLDDLRELLG